MPGMCPFPGGEQLIGETLVPLVRSGSFVIFWIGIILMIIGFVIFRSDINRKSKLNYTPGE